MMQPTNVRAVYSARRASEEAERCLYCFEAPCSQACPAHIDIPEFIAMIRSKNISGASGVVKTANGFANVCGKICPEEIYCQSVCNRASIDAPIMIRELHYYATREGSARGPERFKSVNPIPKNVAVVGGGPAGLSCAFELSLLGYSVTLYESDKLGGVPHSAIPSFRLPTEVLEDDVELLSRNATVIRRNVQRGALKHIRKRFSAVFLGVGLGKDKPVGLKGETLRGVYPVLKFLEHAKHRSNRLPIGKRVVVIGGGNVSLDAAATAKRMGAEEVLLLYRRSEPEMKVWKSELEEARAQGIQILYLTIPVRIVGNGSVKEIICRRTKLSNKIDSSGRRIPVEIAGSDFPIQTNCIVTAIGQSLGSDFLPDVGRSSRGFIAVDRKFRTSLKGVFAGGDAISGEGTIVQSVAHGKQAAREIHAFLSGSER
ncbi:MAG TPA: FAD-dependent oxidoreductase [Bacteroidota bacterium]|nr:FAD-dependent oxidoreductase [Bacteroidota bacterium]